MGPVERVTIVIPTYDDHPDHLDQAVSSALAQTYRDVEVVLVDDGSARPVSLEKGGPTLKVLRQANSGPAAARNLGITQGSGSIVVCLDADDRLDRHYVAEVVEVLRDPQVTIAHPRVREFGDGRGEWGGDAVLDLAGLVDGAIAVSSGFRREDWERAGRMDETMRVGPEDWEFWVRLLATQGGVAAPLPSAILYYRRRPDSRFSTWDGVAARASVRERLLNLDPDALRILLKSAWTAQDDALRRADLLVDDPLNARYWVRRGRRLPSRLRREWDRRAHPSV